MFPLMAGMMYGGRYGFVAGFLGMGAFFPFYLWPLNGWAAPLAALLYLLWFIWQGFCSRKRERQICWWNHPLLALLPVVLAYPLLVITFFPLLLGLNPSFWSPDSITYLPSSVLQSIGVKSALNMLIVLVINLSILKLPLWRRLMGLEVKRESCHNNGLFVASILGAIFCWLMIRIFMGVIYDPAYETRMVLSLGEYEKISLLVLLAAGFFISYLLSVYMEYRLRAEEALKVSLARFQDIAQSAGEYIWETDQQGRFTYLSSRVEEVLGFEREVLKTLDIFEVIHPEDLKRVRCVFQQSMKKRQPFRNLVKRVRNARGQYTWQQVNGMPVFNEQQQLMGFRGTSMDITQQQEAGEQLRHLSERLLLATKIAGIGIWEYDLEQKTLQWDPQMYLLHGIDPQQKENLLVQWLSLPVAEDRPALARVFLHHDSQQNNHYLGHYRIERADGESLALAYTVSVLKDTQGKAMRLLGTCLDNTRELEHLEMQRKLELSTRLTELKQQFLANMSHEIRSPMMGIMGMTELVLQTSLSAQQREFLETIKVSSESLLNVVNDILDLSKIEAGKMTLRPVVFNLKMNGQTILDLFSAMAVQKNLKLEMHYDPALPEEIFADENRLGQVLTNLISNALKFTQAGNVSLSFCLVSEQERELTIAVEIVDTGIGISPEDQTQLFGLFSQLDNSNSRSYEGSGLGLHISQRLVNLMGGQIKLESQEGKGSRFWFHFQAGKLSHTYGIGKKKCLPVVATHPRLGYRVLLVEDKKINQRVISLLLENAGCKVTIAQNGVEALDVFKPGIFDFILLDIQMPVMDGLTALKKLRKQYDQRSLPAIIGLSANAMEGDAEYYLSQGMDDYLTKPVSAAMLYERMQRHALSQFSTLP